MDHVVAENEVCQAERGMCQGEFIEPGSGAACWPDIDGCSLTKLKVESVYLCTARFFIEFPLGGSAVPFTEDDMRRAAQSFIDEFGDGAKEEAERWYRSAKADRRTLIASYWKKVGVFVETISKAK